MPGFDGTGPRGMGPRTGGGRGFCHPMWPGTSPFRVWSRAPWPTPSMAQTPYPSYGATWGAPYYGAMSTPGATPYAPQMTREDELGFLKSQTDMLKGELEHIETRVRDLEAGS